MLTILLIAVGLFLLISLFGKAIMAILLIFVAVIFSLGVGTTLVALPVLGVVSKVAGRNVVSVSVSNRSRKIVGNPSRS